MGQAAVSLCDYTLQAWISSNTKGRDGRFHPGVALFKASHYKLRSLLPSAWNNSQICGLLKKYCRRLIAAILPDLVEMLPPRRLSEDALFPQLCDFEKIMLVGKRACETPISTI